MNIDKNNILEKGVARWVISEVMSMLEWLVLWMSYYNCSDILKDSPQMWEMFNSFMDYAGDLVLVGYDVMRIGSKFLARAGRYANRIVNNLYFDLKRGALNASGEDRVPVSADDVAEMYLTLRNVESKDKEISMEDMFAEWE